jgi:hypothetical protein
VTLKLYVESEAEAELEDAADRYESAVPGLGLDFLAEMRERTLDVLEAPHTFPPFGGVEGVRCAHAVGRFPHLIVYLVLDDTVHVLAYMHPRQRPGYWAHRGPSGS